MGTILDKSVSLDSSIINETTDHIYLHQQLRTWLSMGKRIPSSQVFTPTSTFSPSMVALAIQGCTSGHATLENASLFVSPLETIFLFKLANN